MQKRLVPWVNWGLPTSRRRCRQTSGSGVTLPQCGRAVVSSLNLGRPSSSTRVPCSQPTTLLQPMRDSRELPSSLYAQTVRQQFELAIPGNLYP